MALHTALISLVIVCLLYYTTQDETTLATQQAIENAVKQFGTGYTTTGIQTSITDITSEGHGVVGLQVTSQSLWMAQMSDTQQ